MGNSKGIVFYVAVDGDDGWSGKLKAPNPGKTDGPFETLQRARDEVRALKASGTETAPVDVIIMGGTYFLSKTLLLNEKDSGTQESPITWKACPGEQPVLSGGIRLTGWRPYKNGIIQADLPEGLPHPFMTRQLFYNGKRLPRSKWPKPEDASQQQTWAKVETYIEDDLRTTFKSADPLPAHFANCEGAEAVVWPADRLVQSHGWCKEILPIRSIDPQTGMIRLAEQVMQLEQPPWDFKVTIPRKSPFAIENLVEEIARPGEWALDSRNRVVHLLPPDEDFEKAEIVIPALDCLIRLDGASWVSVEGLTFTQTLDAGSNYHRTGLDGYGAMLPQEGRTYCGEAFHLKNSRYCTIVGCTFDQMGGNAIYIERASYRNAIRKNVIESPGANGIVLIGDKPKHPMFNRVEYNHIRRVGAIINYTAGVFMGLSDGNTIAHNTILDSPHHAMNLATNGTGRNIIEYNEIRRAALETYDVGAINCWMDVPFPNILPEYERSGHIIRFNLIADVGTASLENAESCDARGIYLDDGSSNCVVYGNVVMRCGTAFLIHTGKHNIIENNIMVDCHCALQSCDFVWMRTGNQAMNGFRRGNRFSRNIFVTKDPRPTVYVFHIWKDECMESADENVFFQSACDDYRLNFFDEEHGKPAFSKWQEMGFDRNSVLADPMLVDAEHEDFRLKPDSPALKLGFVEFDISKIGAGRLK